MFVQKLWEVFPSRAHQALTIDWCSVWKHFFLALCFISSRGRKNNDMCSWVANEWAKPNALGQEPEQRVYGPNHVPRPDSCKGPRSPDPGHVRPTPYKDTLACHNRRASAVRIETHTISRRGQDQCPCTPGIIRPDELSPGGPRTPLYIEE